jgi:predicted nucleic acid-binding protein
METWSHSPVKEFEITFFVDTNILSYLIDETYPRLNEFIKWLKTIPIINLVSSEYVLLEFIGIRKREHYFREAVSQTSRLKRPINFSSLLKHHNRFELPEIDFYSLLPAIKSNIDVERERITSEFGIIFYNGFHRNLINPSSDICLCSKISKEDSLVLMSSVLPNEGEKNNNVILITNDGDFHKWFYDENISQNIDDVFRNHTIIKPNLQHIKEIEVKNNRKFNLLENKEDINDIIEGLTVFLQEKLKQQLNELYLGETFSSKNNTFPKDCICFKAIINKSIPNNKYVTIIGKNLDFVYNISHVISLWKNKKIEEETFIATEGDNNLSFKLNFADDISETEKDEILAKLKEPGNLIFLHPNN